MTTTTLNLTGWKLVHTWRESHGECVSYYYQKELEPHLKSRPEWNVVLVHTVHRGSGPDHIETVTGRTVNDYLLAEWVRAECKRDPDNWEKHVDLMSPCSTTSYETWRHLEDDRYYLVTTVAGHGSWARRMRDKEVNDVLDKKFKIS